MRTSFSDTFEAPINITVDGRDLTIPPLTTRDYLPWLDELTTFRRERDKKNIPATAKPIERFKITQAIENSEATPEDLVPFIFTGKGAIRFIEMWLQKGGVMDQGVRAKFIDARRHIENEELAARCSGLLTTQRLVDLFGYKDEVPSPVAEALRIIATAMAKTNAISDAEFQAIVAAGDTLPPKLAAKPTDPSTGQQTATFAGGAGPNPSAAPELETAAA